MYLKTNTVIHTDLVTRRKWGMQSTLEVILAIYILLLPLLRQFRHDGNTWLHIRLGWGQ
jgi:hypothetical protein